MDKTMDKMRVNRCNIKGIRCVNDKMIDSVKMI